MRTSIVTRIAIVSALAAVTGSTFVYAQQSGEPDRAGPARLERYRPTADDFSAFVDARIAAIKAGLRLTAEQEKNWPAFEEAYRNVAKLRTDRILAFREGPPPAADRYARWLAAPRRYGGPVGRRAQADRGCDRPALQEPR